MTFHFILGNSNSLLQPSSSLPFIPSFIHSINRQTLLGDYYILGTMLGAGDTSRKKEKTDETPVLVEVTF